MSRERKLTEAELRRKEFFDKKCNELAEKGYVRKDLTVGVVAANILALIVMMPLCVFFIWLYLDLNGWGMVTFDSVTMLAICLVLLLLLTVVHELIHGVTWACFAKNHFKSIEFGVIWKMLTPYCTCCEELKKWQYVLGGAMPTVILGIIPAIIAVAISNWLIFILALAMIFGGGGDAIIILKLLSHRAKGKQVVYIDHPYECGVVAFEKSGMNR